LSETPTRRGRDPCRSTSASSGRSRGKYGGARRARRCCARRRAATRSTYSWPPAPSLPAVFFRPPLETELARRRHVAGERGCGDAGWTRQVAFTAEPHPVLPVPVEGGDRAFSGVQRVRALTETRSAPRLADLSADRAEHVGNRLAVETRIRPL